MKVAIINKPTKKDYTEIFKLHNEVFSKFPDYEEYSAEVAFRRMNKDNDSSVFKVSDERDNLIAYALCYERYKDYYHIWQLGVNEKNRNIGIASNLYETIENYARNKKYKGVTLNTFNTYELNIRLIGKRGYEIYDTDKSGKYSSNPKIMFKLIFK